MHLPLSLVTLLLLFLLQPIFASLHRSIRTEDETRQLRFGNNGLFRILQVADMHYANGESSECLNVLPNQMKSCSDLNTTAFVNRMILAVKPDLIVYTGNFNSRINDELVFLWVYHRDNSIQCCVVFVRGQHLRLGYQKTSKIAEHVVRISDSSRSAVGGGARQSRPRVIVSFQGGGDVSCCKIASHSLPSQPRRL